MRKPLISREKSILPVSTFFALIVRMKGIATYFSLLSAYFLISCGNTDGVKTINLIPDKNSSQEIPNQNLGTPTVSFSSVSSVSENAGTISISATLDFAISQDVTFTLRSVNGGITASPIFDYIIETSSPVVIPAGSVTTEILLTIIDDNEIENAENVGLEFSDPVNATLDIVGSFVIEVIDNDDLNNQPFEGQGPVDLLATCRAADNKQNPTEIELTWSMNPTSATDLQIERRVGTQLDFQTLDVIAASETTYIDTDVNLNTVYEYRLAGSKIDSTGATILTDYSNIVRLHASHTNCPLPQDKVYLFSAGSFQGNFANIAGKTSRQAADDLCKDAMALLPQLNGFTTLAMVALDVGDDIQSLPIPIDRPIGGIAPETDVAENWRDFLGLAGNPPGLNRPLTTAGISSDFWTGTNSKGIFDAGNSCTGFKSIAGGTMGQIGSPSIINDFLAPVLPGPIPCVNLALLVCLAF